MSTPMTRVLSANPDRVITAGSLALAIPERKPRNHPAAPAPSRPQAVRPDDRPGDLLARTPGALEAMLASMGAREESDETWTWPSPKGGYGTPNIGIFSDDDGVTRFTAFGTAAQGQLGMESDDSWSAWDLLGNHIAGGDWSLAARIAKQHAGDAQSLVEAVEGQSPEELTKSFPKPKGRTRVTSGAVAKVPHPDRCKDTVEFAMTELGFAERWLTQYGDSMMYVRGIGWHRWTGKRWKTTHNFDSTYFATVRAVANNETDHIKKHDKDGEYDPAASMKARMKHASEAERMETARAMSAVEKIAQGLVARDAEELDTDDLIVNTPMGIFDLRTGELGPHDPDKLCTMMTAGSGDISAPLPNGAKRILDGMAASNPDIPQFLQMMLGVAITGHTAKAFTHLYGQANTGKSTLLEALVAAFGSYAATSGIKVFREALGRSGDTPDPTLMGLIGKRMVYVDEAATNRLDSDLLKTLSSGQVMTTRALHSAPVTWRSKASLFFSGNGPLSLQGEDPGLVTRLHTMKVTAAPSERDESIKEELALRESQDGLLAWALKYATEWVQGGCQELPLPESVHDERKDYLDESDPILAWWDARVEMVEEFSPGSRPFTTTDLHEDYKLFMEASRMARSAVEMRRFVNLLEARGVQISERTQKTFRDSVGRTEKVRGRFALNLHTVDGEVSGGRS